MYDDIAEETGYDRDALRHYKRVAENDNSLLRNNRWLFCCALLLCDGHIGKVPFSYLTTCRVLCSVLSIVDRTGKLCKHTICKVGTTLRIILICGTLLCQATICNCLSMEPQCKICTLNLRHFSGDLRHSGQK